MTKYRGWWLNCDECGDSDFKMDLREAREDGWYCGRKQTLCYDCKQPEKGD